MKLPRAPTTLALLGVPLTFLLFSATATLTNAAPALPSNIQLTSPTSRVDAPWYSETEDGELVQVKGHGLGEAEGKVDKRQLKTTSRTRSKTKSKTRTKTKSKTKTKTRTKTRTKTVRVRLRDRLRQRRPSKQRGNNSWGSHLYFLLLHVIFHRKHVQRLVLGPILELQPKRLVSSASTRHSQTDLNLTFLSFLPPFQKTRTATRTATKTATPLGTTNPYLTSHNIRRAKSTLGGPVPALKYSAFLSQQALNWTNKLAKDCAFYHPPPSYGYNSGQNLFVSWGYVPTAEDVLTDWTENEIEFYDASIEDCNGGVCGHYTQVCYLRIARHGVCYIYLLN